MNYLSKESNNLFLVLLLAVLTTIIMSCNNIDSIIKDDSSEVFVTITFNSGLTRAYSYLDNERKIDKIRIYLFKDNNMVGMNLFDCTGKDIGESYIIKSPTGSIRIIAIVNEPYMLSEKLDGVATFENLENIIMPKINSLLSLPLTMIGSVEAKVESGMSNDIRVDLVRLASKINLYVKKGIKADADIILTDIRLYNATSSASLIEGVSVPNQDYWSQSFSINPNISLSTITSEIWCGESSLYTYENTLVEENAQDNATYIIMNVLYDGAPVEYKAFVNDKNSANNNHGYSIKRNHQYNITATITNRGEYDGLILHTEVLPWTVEESYIIINRDFTIYPNVDYENRELELSSDLLEIRFKLNTLDDVRWEAHITNIIDFVISLSNGNDAIGISGEEYVIQVKPRNQQLRKGIQTELYILVEGNEIPLLSDSDLIGSGNRMIIKRKAGS